MQPIIEVKNINVSIESINILKNVTFNVMPQEVVAIIGPNGSGKTTLFKALMNLVAYTGEIKILRKKAQQSLKKIGYVPQRFDFDKSFPITVMEFLNLNTCPQHGRQRLNQVLKELEIEKFKNQMLGQLSGGQLQRVLIANAIIHEPEILLFDEPTSGIDVEGVRDFYSIIKHLNETYGTTILLISHEISMVYKFAKKIICLNKGIVCHGEPQLLTQDVLKKLYGEKVEFHDHIH